LKGVLRAGFREPLEAKADVRGFSHGKIFQKPRSRANAGLGRAATGGFVTVASHHSDHSATRADVPTSERIGNVTRSGLAR
jgi:hypothetical protein